MLDIILTFQEGADLEQIPIFLDPFRLEQGQLAHKQMTHETQHLFSPDILLFFLVPRCVLDLVDEER